MYIICFYVPASHLEVVKLALFEQGAGKIGDYDCCAWQVLGDGQFRPLSNSKPLVGTQGKIEQVPEYKVEMVCADELIHSVIAALKKAHPYEEPAYYVWKSIDLTQDNNASN